MSSEVSRWIQDLFELFCKEVGVPVNLIVDEVSAQQNLSVKWFWDQVVTTLNMLEHATPWANRAELYVGLLMEVVRKDTRGQTIP